MTSVSSIALRILRDTLTQRPIDHKRLQEAVVAYVQTRSDAETPEGIIADVRAAFDDLVHSDYTGAYTLRTQAASWAIQEYYPRPNRIGD